jgi:hypothetical protein
MCVTDNVDYDRLKNLIKVNTTKDQARALAIPGQADTALERFEDLFFDELCNEHDRPDLFVRSKVDEINCRLRTSVSPECQLIANFKARILAEEDPPATSTRESGRKDNLSQEVRKARP